MGKETEPGDSLPRLLYLSHTGKYIGTVIYSLLVVYFFAAENDYCPLILFAVFIEIFKNSGQVFCLSGINGKIFDNFKGVALGSTLKTYFPSSRRIFAFSERTGSIKICS